MSFFGDSKDFGINGGSFNSAARDINYIFPGGDSLQDRLHNFREALDSINSEAKRAGVSHVIINQPDAGKWLLSNPIYSAWKGGETGSGHLFWLTGIPGAGKTVLSSIVINDLSDIQEQDNSVAVLFFYFEPQKTTKLGATELFASLLDQLLGKVPQGSATLRGLLNTYTGGPKKDIPLTRALRDLSNDFKRIFIVIDGLEECDGAKNVLRDLEWLAKKLYICVSSRDYPDIRTELRDVQGVRIRQEDIVEDVRKFVETRARHITDENQQLREFIIQTLVDGAQGCFRWPASHIRQLRDPNVVTEHDIQTSLGTIPKEITSTVDVALRTIASQPHADIFLSVVRLIVGARQPITAFALIHAISASQMDTTWDPKLMIHNSSFLVDGCANLVTRVPAADRSHYRPLWPGPVLGDEVWEDEFWQNDILDSDSIVVPFHFSVRTTLLSDREKAREVHNDIAALCLKYLNLILRSKKPEGLNPSQYPFAKYALFGWPFHLRASGRRPADFGTFFAPWRSEASKVMAWVPTRAHMAVRLDLPIIQGLGRSELMTEDDNGLSPLHTAIKHSASLAMIDCLLEEKVDVNQRSVDDESATALHFVVHHANPAEVVQRLLHHGADCNARDANSRTPLHIICGGSYSWEQLQYYKGVLRQLLDSGNNMDIDARDRQGITPLHLAALRGYVPFVTLLLEKGASVDVCDIQRRTILHDICAQQYPSNLQNDYTVILRQLLNRQYNTLLHLSALHGNAAFVAFLLEEGAKANDIDNAGQTALHKICGRMHPNDQTQNHDCELTIKYLLGKGAKVNTMDKNGMTPLKMAEKSGHEHVIVQLRSLSTRANSTVRMTANDNQHESAPPRAIGIHFGTSYSRVAVWQHDHVEVITNDEGSRMIGSYVAFDNTQRFIGEEPKGQAKGNPENVVFCAKRLLGRRFDDPEVQSDIKYFPFKVINNGGRPCIEVTFKGETKQFLPEEIAAMVIGRLKLIAESRLGAKVTNVVLTVPISFSNIQRQALKDAATIAGLNILQVISEPSAAAITFGLNPVPEDRNIMIFGLGGGTCNVSILKMKAGVFKVRAVAGNAYLGGKDFDARLVDYFVQEFKHKHGKDLATSPQALNRLYTACIHAKHELSATSRAHIDLGSLFQDIDFYSTISRDIFEKQCRDLFQNTLEPIVQVLREAEMNKSDVDEIVFVGGSTRMPRIVKQVSDFFYGKQPYKGVDPLEATVCGAAVQAAILTGDTSDKIQHLRFSEVLSFSLGIETASGVMNPLLMRNMPVPARRAKDFKLTDLKASSDQRSVLVKIYEGNNPFTKDNILLGKFELPDLIPGSLDVPRVEIVFDICVNGILHVTAYDKASGKSKRIKVINEESQLSREELKHLTSEAERHMAEDVSMVAARTSAKTSLESFVYGLLDSVDNGELASRLTSDDKSRFRTALTDAISWLDHSEEASKEEYELKQKELEGYVHQWVDDHHRGRLAKRSNTL